MGEEDGGAGEGVYYWWDGGAGCGESESGAGGGFLLIERVWIERGGSVVIIGWK